MKPTLLALLFFTISQEPHAQPGCPDPQATNFDAAATSNDGSCLYPVTTYSPVFKADLPGALKEISGLSKAGAKWWGHNDSGGDETFFSLDPESGDILQDIKLNNSHNRDWEDIASDTANLYLGDFGNNNNDRQNLGIYKIPLFFIDNSNSETVQDDEWTFIPFAYADQTDFGTLPEDSTVFDCEAMIFFNEKIHLFTKNRLGYTSTHYIMNAATGLAEKAETFDSEGLITGASRSPDGQLIALVGYDLRPFIPTVFCWLLWDWQAGTDLFFAGNKRRIELGTALQIGQVESIGFDSDRTGYLSNERTTFNGVTIVDESVRWFDFSAWVPASVGTSDPGGTLAGVSVFPNPFSRNVHFQFLGNKKPDLLLAKNQAGQTVLRLDEMPETLDLGFLPKGFYFFEMWGGGARAGSFRGVKLE